MIARQRQFEAAWRAAAEEAMNGLDERERVRLALRVRQRTTDADVAGLLTYAANQLTEHAGILVREAFERECG